MENATAGMDEATKSVWRVTATLIDFSLHCIELVRGLLDIFLFFYFYGKNKKTKKQNKKITTTVTTITKQ